MFCILTSTGHKSQTPPEVISDLISSINTRFHEKSVNSCLVTRYIDGDQFCPSHQDDEDEIGPDSNIYTLSIGAERDMHFHKRASPEESHLCVNLPARSLVSFSRLSQEAWKHSIPPSTHVTAARYSFTFRLIKPYYINSTVICGDSNTEKLLFGDDSRGSFGKWMPGRRMQCYHIKEVPAPCDIGPHRNIVLHVGVNDIKAAPQSQIPGFLKTLEAKCQDIINAFPKSNLYICPLLPTKDPHKKARVYMMNEGFTSLSNRHQNILLMPHNYYDLFCDPKGLLHQRLGKFWNGNPKIHDDLHVGATGIKLLASCIKHCVLRRKGSLLSPSVDSHTSSRSGFSGDYVAAVKRNPQYGQYGRALTQNPGINNGSYGHY